MSTAEQQRKWRASKGARTGKPGRPRTVECGTTRAYRRHLENGEPTCQACRDEWNRYHRERYAAKKET